MGQIRGLRGKCNRGAGDEDAGGEINSVILFRRLCDLECARVLVWVCAKNPVRATFILWL